MITSLLTKALLFLSLPCFFTFSWLPAYADNILERLNLPHEQVVVLMYHHISNRPVGKITITPQLFSQHLDMLKSKGYHVISVEQYARFLEGKASIPNKSVAITFDDGYESFYTYAYPELLKRHMPATNFIIVSVVGSSQEPLRRLTWSQMKEMQVHGMSFYPHAFQDHYLAAIYPDRYHKKSCLAGRIWLSSQKRWETESEYIRRVNDDLKKAKEIMEKELGKPMLHYSWPYGQDSPVALKAARSIGFKYFYYVNNRSYGAWHSFFCIPRLDAGNNHVSAQALVSGIHKFMLKQDLYAFREDLHAF